MSGVTPIPAAIKLSRSSCGSTHAGMYRGVFVPSSSYIAATPCERMAIVSMDTSTRRILYGVGAVCGGSLSLSVLGGGVCVVRSCSSRIGVVNSVMSSSVVWCLVPASNVTRRRSCGEDDDAASL